VEREKSVCPNICCRENAIVEEMAAPRTSMMVAPLRFKKSSHDGSSSNLQGLGLSRPKSSQQTYSANIEDMMADHNDQLPPFQNYLRAFYPFQPAASLSTSTVTLPLNAGDIILVHSIHTNGWADGTLLESGARGWLPTNYCEAYDYTPVRPLLKALTEFWDVIRSDTGSTMEVFRNQDYMRGLIAGVRFLLERSDCLTRDSMLVKKYDSLRRIRKAMLSDLSLLVKVAKKLQELAMEPVNAEAIEATLDDMLLKAFKIVTRAVKFLDIWSEELDSRRTQDNSATVNMPAENKGNTGASSAGSRSPRKSPNLSRQSSGPGPSTRNSIWSQHSRTSAQSRPRDMNISQPQIIDFQQRTDSLANRSPLSPQSMSFPGSKRMSFPSKRMSITHRMSYTAHSNGKNNPNLASEKINRSYDAFLGVLASFLGSHMQSRSSSELLLTTQQAVKSCRELLSTIEIVLDHEMRRSDSLLEAKDAMYDKITELVHAAREVFRPIHDEDTIMLPEQGKQLVNAATACVRGAGDCVAKTRLVLEQIGDFEVDPNAVRASVITYSHTESSATSRTPTPNEEPAQYIPAEPTQAPPALPQLEIPETMFPILSPMFSDFSDFTPISSIPDTPDTLAMSVTDETPPNTGRMSVISDLRFPIPGNLNQEVALKREKSVARTIVNSTGSDSTFVSSQRDSGPSMRSQASTRASTPEQEIKHLSPPMVTEGRFSGSQTTLAEDVDETEAQLLEKTFAHELMFNKEGHVIGGSLSALIEKLTAYDSTPDALFVSTFYLTFRLFASPQTFAEALQERFEYVAETSRVAGPVRLRVYNIFKGWLESHWRHDCDDVALPFILDFARHVLMPILPTAGKRLEELAEKVSTIHGPLVPRLVSSMGKTNTQISPYVNPDTPLPPPVVSKSQLASLRTWKMGGPGVNILDFDPLELARQITLKVASIFCSILPEELLATEWMKRSGSLAVNVRAMSTLSTDLANLVADSILQLEEPKKRAVIIKHWVKIAKKCLELNNYDSLMAIICSLNSSTVLRLKKTWESVSQKTKNAFEDLKQVVDISRNYTVLRQRLQGLIPPCLPFVGIYLTDLTFVDHGNPTTRQLTTEDEESIPVINYDKHMKTAKIISELQRFQIPYRLTEVPELQTWMQDQLVRVRSAGEKSFQNHYRRSLVLEPREQRGQGPSPTVVSTTKDAKERFDFLAWTHTTKDKSITTNG
jgi:hypothetical protein